MSSFETYQSIVGQVCSLDRYVIIERLTHSNTGLALDFTIEYLEACTTDQLRHLLVAALWQMHQKQVAAFAAKAS